jgi:2'-hydroxyisoflavone reductase
MLTPSRRDVVKAAAALGLSLAASPLALARPVRREGLKVLILGGTGYLGPWVMKSALARGHSVTLFNRGRTEARRRQAHVPVEIPGSVEVLVGNRDPDKAADDWKPADQRDPKSPKGLASLEGRKWDAVVDTSGYVPRIVRASAELLAPSVRHYIFISTVSVYRDTARAGADESAPLATIPDPTVEEMGARFENYGPLKALCEQAAEKAMPGRVANVRPGFIVGPGDNSGRFPTWPVRAARGGDMLAPGSPDDPVQIIDVRDLADWIVRLAEQRTAGAFDALGPATPWKWGRVLDACNKAGGGKARLVWVPTSFLDSWNARADAEKAAPDRRLDPGGNLPIWLPPEGETLGFHQRNPAKAVKAGLTFRPVEETALATLEWYNSLDEKAAWRKTAGISAELEADVLKAFAQSKG